MIVQRKHIGTSGPDPNEHVFPPLLPVLEWAGAIRGWRIVDAFITTSYVQRPEPDPHPWRNLDRSPTPE